jgi:hypothetical protein
MGNQLKQLNIHHVINLVALVMSVDEQIRPHITKVIEDASSSKPLAYNIYVSDIKLANKSYQHFNYKRK